MRVPINWLKEYVDVGLSAGELADRLTFSGIEVEGIETVGSDLAGIVAGEVLAVRPHPSADRLKVCEVFTGADTIPVVCGADNFRAGDKAALAPAGVVLPGGTQIREVRLRGELSRGMLCAEDELGISDDHTGILVLPPDVAAGTPLSRVLGGPEAVLELEVTWNRPDCLSMIGIAREVAALCSLPLRLPPAEYEESGPAVESRASVAVDDPHGCPRYTARVACGARLGISPLWMRRRLILAGVRPIANVVDVTNYVMIECGQPLHAFDAELLRGRRIVVRRARDGETMRTLDGLERTITPAMLMICDAEGPVAVAGIMGGAGSEIRESTTEVLLESAAFDAALIHRTSVALGLGTESSFRFERGIDVEGVEWASRRAMRLIAEVSGASIARGVLDARRPPAPDRRIVCRHRRVRETMGVEVGGAEIESIFTRLGLPIVDRLPGAATTVQVPSFRGDLEREADLVEEVARIHGLQSVPSAVPAARIVPDADDPRPRAVQRCRENLVALGLCEVMHYSFVSPQTLSPFGEGRADDLRRVRIPNPVSADHSVLRDSLMPQMVQTLGRNLAHQTSSAALFEIGRVFLRQSDGGIREQERLCIGLMGRPGRTGPDGNRPPSPEEMFLWTKGVLDALLRAQHVENATFRNTSGLPFEPGCAVDVQVDGHVRATAGLLSGDLRRAWRMVEPVGIAEVEIDFLCRPGEFLPALSPVSAYPAVRRDLALIVDQSVPHETVVAAIRRGAPAELTSVTLFDIFIGEGIGKGRKSLAYSLVYRSMARSLTDEEVNGYHAGVMRAVRQDLAAEIRDS